MAVFDLFSKRQRRARGEAPDVYVYDRLPEALRVQIVHIIRDAFGSDRYASDHAANAYELVHDALCREYGVFELVPNSHSKAQSVFNFFLTEKSVERALDVVELCFRFMCVHIAESSSYKYNTDRKIEPDGAVRELNERLKEHGVGYQFESNEILRVDSEFLHAEAVRPALTLLRNKGFKGANEEFLEAHEHYRHGRTKDALVSCLKAFESTMKAICKKRGWRIEGTATARTLIDVCMKNGLVPAYMQAQMGSLRSLLESGVPTIRNKEGGHGQGAESTIVPEFLARYALNLTASCILFLIEANSYA